MPTPQSSGAVCRWQRRATPYTPTIVPVTEVPTAALPYPWPQLAATDAVPDYVLRRARAFFALAERDKYLDLARHALEITGLGFAEPFESECFQPRTDDPDAAFKQRGLAALIELSEFFRGAIPTLVWDAYAHLVARPNPLQPATILSQVKELPHPYWMVDAVFHATPKVYQLWNHVQTVFFRHTGMVPNHNCDCDCEFRGPEAGGNIDLPMRGVEITVASGALLSHLFCEMVLIGRHGLPFELGLSPEAAQVLVFSAGC